MKILDWISKNPNTCGCEINQQLNLSQSTVSHHIKILLDADLINDNKKGALSLLHAKSCNHKQSNKIFTNVSLGDTYYECN